MSCPTPEQLAAISLGLVDEPRIVEHAQTCEACARVLAIQRNVTDSLASMHVEFSAHHARERVELLERLPDAPRRRATATWQRWVVGGIAAAAALLITFVIISPNRLSAMERIERAIEQVQSLSCQLTNRSDLPATDDLPARSHVDRRLIHWRAPVNPDQFGDLHATTTVDTVRHALAGDTPRERIVDLVEIHPSGKAGILIDHVAKRYYHVPPLHSRDLADSPPLLWLQAVRERAGKMVRELGAREINGRVAQGIVMSFDDRPEFKDHNPVEVWFDPQTNLPVEFRFQYTGGDSENLTDRWSATDIEWNRDFDAKQFDVTPPTGFPLGNLSDVQDVSTND